MTKTLFRYLCGHCVSGRHRACYAPDAYRCACAEDYHRPGRQVRQSMAAHMRPDLTGADRDELAVLIEERDAS